MEAVFFKAVFSLKGLPQEELPEVALLGRSNVGKSSLINCLLNRKNLAKTSSTPGKTRSINFYRADGLYLVDLPGYGFAKVPKTMRRSWEGLILGYLSARDCLCLVVLVLDVRRELDPIARMLFNWLKERNREVAVLLTKADKVSRSEAYKKRALLMEELMDGATGPILFSSRTGMGKDELWSRIDRARGLCKLRSAAVQ